MGDRRMRAQAATEFLLIVGLATLILLPTTFLFFRVSEDSKDKERMQQIEKLGTDVINTAERVYYYSEPSKMEIVETMPDNVKYMNISKDWDQDINLFIIYYRTKGKDQPIVFKSNVNINGTFDAKDYSPGKKTIVIEARRQGNYVYSHIDFK